MTTLQPVHPDDYVSEITVEIGLALRAMLEERYAGRIRERLRDSPLTTVPGHTIFVPSSESYIGASTTAEASERILPTILREVRRQLDGAGISEASEQWSFAYTWDGHGLFGDGQFVEEGFRFDAYVEVFGKTATPCRAVS